MADQLGRSIVAKQMTDLISVLTPMFNVMNMMEPEKVTIPMYFTMTTIQYIFLRTVQGDSVITFELLEYRTKELLNIINNVLNAWPNEDKYTQFVKSAREEIEAAQVALRFLKSVETA